MEVFLSNKPPVIINNSSHRCVVKVFIKPFMLNTLTLIPNKTMFYFSQKTSQILNPDGTVTLKIVHKDAYFHEIASDLHKSFRKYSDIKILCGDGSTFDANKSILSRLTHLSSFLQPSHVESGESKSFMIL